MANLLNMSSVTTSPEIGNMPMIRARRITMILLFLLLGVGIHVNAPMAQADNPKVVIDSLRRIPVFYEGRIMPFESFASKIVEEICNDAKGSVTFDLRNYTEFQVAGGDLLKDDSGFKELFPEGKRSWKPSELVYSWMVEGEKWENIPFIHAKHNEVRKVIGLPVADMAYMYAAPSDLSNSVGDGNTVGGLLAWLQKVDTKRSQAMAATGSFTPAAVDEGVNELLRRYEAFRSISLDASASLTHSPIPVAGARGNFMGTFDRLFNILTQSNAQGETMLDQLQMFAQIQDADISTAVNQTFAELQAIVDQTEGLRGQGRAVIGNQIIPSELPEISDVNLATLQQAVSQLPDALGSLEAGFRKQDERLAVGAGNLSESEHERFQAMFFELQSKAIDLKSLAIELNAALYANRHTMLVTPSMNPYALSKNRDTIQQIQPWISIQAVLHGDKFIESELSAAREVKAVRTAWSRAANTFRNRTAENRGSQFNIHIQSLITALSDLGAQANSSRDKALEQLTSIDRDDDLIAYTKYPTSVDDLTKLDAELSYNSMDPFLWTFLLSFLALASFALSFGKHTHKMYITGMVLMVLGLIWTIYGFYLRVRVTGWAPVTNMYETMVFVPFIVSVLAFWFMLLPLTQASISKAWNLTLLPFRIIPTKKERPATKSGEDSTIQYVATAARLLLLAGIFYFLTQTSYADGGRPYFELWPEFWSSENMVTDASLAAVTSDAQTQAMDSSSRVGTWAISIGCLVLILWVVPRFLVATPLAIGFATSSYLKARKAQDKQSVISTAIEQLVSRRSFALAGTFMTAIGGLYAFYAAASPDVAISADFDPLQPVLRSNFWLTIHVLTIVASYGAGLLALGLGNIAMYHYAFGKYQDPVKLDDLDLPEGVVPSSGDSESKSRPPAACASLSDYAYKAVKVAVILLTAGTILGGLWADVSWGRFWGWDPKEVWALISLLVYLAILHGRYAGWFNHFGMIFGTVLGASAIVMSWYGVNFVLPQFSSSGTVGLHSYGEGSGGLGWIVAFIVVEWTFLAVATVKFTSKTK